MIAFQMYLMLSIIYGNKDTCLRSQRYQKRLIENQTILEFIVWVEAKVELAAGRAKLGRDI